MTQAAKSQTLGTPQAVIVTPGGSAPLVIQIPRSRAEVEALRAQRSELSDQLVSATGRRNAITKQLLTATGPERAGLEARAQQLDNRLIQIERDIQETGRILAGTPGNLLSGSSSTGAPFGRLSSGQLTGIGVVFTIFVLSPMAIAFAIGLLRRQRLQPASPGVSPELGARFDNMERGMEAMAIEIERMSEGQRFVTKLLSEGPARLIDVAGRGEAVPAARAAEAHRPA